MYSRGVPPIPVPSDAAADRPVRGALGFTPTYNDDYTGWPVAPKHRTHGVYGTFLNPTTGWPSGMPPPQRRLPQGDRHPHERRLGPPPRLRHRGRHGPGREAGLADHPAQRTRSRGEVGIGHFRYHHVVPCVEVGEKVEAGQEIGQTCPGWWHVHLEEHATVGGKRVTLNPLRPGGKLAPVTDQGNPFVREMRIYAKEDENNATPRPLSPDRVRGVVVPVALAMDSFPFKDWPKAPVRSPARLPRLDRAAAGADHRP